MAAKAEPSIELVRPSVGSTLMISNSTFSGNQAVGGTGPDFGVAGAIDVEFASVATINNSSFTGNVASGGTGCIAQGGALFAEGLYPDFEQHLVHGQPGHRRDRGGIHLKFPSGEAEAGAILVFIGATVNIGNSSFTGNVAQGGTGSAGGFGGAIVNTGGTVTLTSTTLTANKAIGGTGTGGAPHSTRTWLEVAASTTSLEVLSRSSTAVDRQPGASAAAAIQTPPVRSTATPSVAASRIMRDAYGDRQHAVRQRGPRRQQYLGQPAEPFGGGIDNFREPWIFKAAR